MDAEKRTKILNIVRGHANVLASYMESGGVFPLPETVVDATVVSATGYFLKKAEVWSNLGGKTRSALTPLFKKSTKRRHQQSFDSGIPLDRFGGTMRIVLRGENGCSVSGDRVDRVHSFLRRISELSSEEIKSLGK